MKTLANLSNAQSDWARFSDARDASAFLSHTHMDGLELLLYEDTLPDALPVGSVVGVHLGYFPSWMPLWTGNADQLIADYGSLSYAFEALGCASKADLVSLYRHQLDLAARLHADYVVFHVSEASPGETVSYRFRYTSEEVISGALELLNMVLAGRDDPFLFLVENLWWPGFTFTEPRLTQRLLEGIPCPRKGIMLDLGHLMHTDRTLSSLPEAARYMGDMVALHGPLARSIRGVHLHQTLSGRYVDEMLRQDIVLKGSAFDQLMEAYRHIMAIDAHRPFLDPSVVHVLEQIAPDYLVYEFITESRAQHEDWLLRQHQILQYQGEKNVF